MKRLKGIYVLIPVTVLIVILNLLGLNVVQAQAAGIIAVAWSPDGSKIVVGGADGLLQILDTNGAVIRNITGLTVQVNTVDWSPDNTKIVSGSDDGSVFIWDVGSGQKIATLVGADQYLWSVDWSPDGTKILASGSYTLTVWDALTDKQLATTDAGDVADAKWSPDSTKIACANSAGYLNIFTPLLGNPISSLTINDGEDNGPISVSWSLDGSKIAAGTGFYNQKTLDFSYKIEIWDFVTEKVIASYTGLTDITDTIDAVAFSPNGQQLASASQDGSVRIWNTAAGQQIASFSKARLHTTSVAWSPDGSRLAYGSGRSGLQIVSAPINVTYTPGPPPTATPIPPTLSAQNLQAFLQPTACTRTCFMGLQPDITTKGEFETWIVQHDVYISTDNTGKDYTGKMRSEMTWSMDNPSLAIGSGDQIRITAIFIEDKLVSIVISMNIPIVSILEAYGQPSYVTYFQYIYYAIYPTQKLFLSFPENLSSYYEPNTVQITLGNDDVISQHRNELQYFPFKKCTGDNLVCTTIQTATPYPKF